MSKKPTQPIHSSKQLSSPESRAQKRRNIVISSLAFLVLIAVGTVFVIMNWDELRAQRSVATANGDRISLRDLEGRTRYERYSLIRSAEEFYQYAQILGPDQSVDSYIAEILNQIEIMLAPETVGQSAMDHLIEDLLIRQEAGRRGLVVTEGEIEKALQASFGFYRDGTPTPCPPGRRSQPPPSPHFNKL